MKKRALLISLLASAGTVAGLFASGAANAQLNLKQFGIGGGDSAAEASGAASPGGLSQLLQTYVGANQQVLSGQSTLASAMGLSSAACCCAAARPAGPEPTTATFLPVLTAAGCGSLNRRS